MPKLLSVTPSHLPEKKYNAHFKGMDDFTKTKDTEQRERYRSRHAKDLTTNNPMAPGYLSWYLLWGAHPALRKNLEAFKRKFNL